MFEIGNIYNFKVKKITDIAYMLEKDNEEVFMHFNDALTKYEVGDTVSAFLYLDKYKRLSATTKHPFITLNTPNLVEVVAVDDYLGVFVNNNISKDFLISKDDIKYDYDTWPIIGDKLFCILKNKKNLLYAKILNKTELLNYYNPNISYEVGEKIKGYVQYIGNSGINIFSIDGINIFVHKTNIRDKYRLGEEVLVKIIHKNEFDYNGTLIEQKELMIDKDSKLILNKLKLMNGIMPYDAKTDSDTIYNVFKMSKKAFKRALGNLYKNKLIYFENDKTIEVKNGK